MTEYTQRLRRSIRYWQVLGAFGLSFVYLFIAVVCSRWLSEEWQNIIWRAFELSLAGALMAVAYASWKQNKATKHEPVEKPDES